MELAGHVRVLYQRRRRRKLVIMAATLLGFGGLLWHGLSDRQGRELAKSIPENPAAPFVESVAADDFLQEAHKQIDREESIVQRLLAAERVSRLATTAKAATMGLDGQLRRDEQVGQAAMTILLTGDQRAKRPDSVQAAREDYVCVMQVFPNTIWAERAGVRLAALKP